MLMAYVAGICTGRSLLVRFACRGLSSSSFAREKGQDVWINEHSDKILRDLREKNDTEKQSSYEVLIEGVHRRKELLLSYNIGIPVEDREKDMNKQAAKLVGLAMPEEE